MLSASPPLRSEFWSSMDMLSSFRDTAVIHRTSHATMIRPASVDRRHHYGRYQMKPLSCDYVKKQFSHTAIHTIVAVLALLQVCVAGELAEKPAPRCTLGKPFVCADYGGNKVCMVDKQGRIVWQHPAARPQDVWLLPNGNVLFSHIKGATEVTRQKETVWEYETATGNEVHACQPLPNGLVMIAESGPMRIIEVDREGTVVRKVDLTTKIKRAHRQMRCARKLSNGHYIVGQYGDGFVREYDTTGAIIREIPQKMAFSGIRLPNGNTLIATGDAHRAIEVDESGKTVWEINENDLPGNPLRFVAGLQRLANGNTLVCNWGGHGHVGQQPQVFEVTREKKVVGELYDFSQFGTISGILVIENGADVSQFEVYR